MLNGRKVSAALSGLPDDMVAEAMEPGRSGRGFSWLRLTACLAIIVGLCFGFWPAQPEIVTAPGLLTVTVYAEDKNSQTGYKSERLKLGVRPVLGAGWSPAISKYPGLPIMLSVSSEDFPSDQITFEISVSEGEYLDWGVHTNHRIVELSDEFTVNNFALIYWSIDFDDDYYGNSYDHVYTYIVIKCEGNIIGYSVVRYDRRFGEYGATISFDPFFVKSIIFPKIGGQYQSVTYDYVETELREKE